MGEYDVQRRLSAILAADVAGYTRLVEQDRDGTVAAWRSARESVIDPSVAAHAGRLVKLTGDGFLAEFATVEDAVRCAIAMQKKLLSNTLDFRMGINLGDIVDDGEDIHGEGVNIAARIEGLAEPGGTCISGDVYNQVRNRLAHNYEDLGEHDVKNVSAPVRIFRIVAAKAKLDPVSPSLSDQPDKPSIAVLPFDNMSGDPEQEYFADGIVEDIITALSRISQMRVIARNSTFAYKGQAIDLRRVAGELGVRYVLEGSVRSVGTRLRITAQLIAAEDGSHLWAERFDRSVDDIFEIQDEITKEIVTALRVNLTDGEVASVISHGTKNVEAWQLCFEATELFMRFSASDYLQARALAERALKLDPNFSYAWATLGFTYWWDGRLGYTGDTKEKFARADEYARKAMSIDSTVSWAIGLSAMVAAPIGRHQEGIDIARRGVDLYPGNADVRAFLGFALLHAGQLAEAVEHIRAAMDFNPFYPNWYLGGLQSALRGLGDLEGVLSIANEVLEKEPGFLGSWLARAYVYQKTGRRSDALAAIREVQKLAPNLRVEHLPNMTLINDKAITKDYSTVLREAGLPE